MSFTFYVPNGNNIAIYTIDKIPPKEYIDYLNTLFLTHPYRSSIVVYKNAPRNAFSDELWDLVTNLMPICPVNIVI